MLGTWSARGRNSAPSNSGTARDAELQAGAAQALRLLGRSLGAFSDVTYGRLFQSCWGPNCVGPGVVHRHTHSALTSGQWALEQFTNEAKRRGKTRFTSLVTAALNREGADFKWQVL